MLQALRSLGLIASSVWSQTPELYQKYRLALMDCESHKRSRPARALSAVRCAGK